MNMMTVAIRAIAAITVVVTTMMTAAGATGRTGLDRATTRTISAAASLKARRRAVRASGVSRSIGMIRPQYLPALARARSLRLRMAHVAIATPRRR
jgi:hypothetical protein